MISREAQPLKILIVGAGIGGLAAAAGLSKQGHDVEVFERSQLNREIGAAICLPPNVGNFIRELGMIPEDYGAVTLEKWANYTATGQMMASLNGEQFSMEQKSRFQMIHRVDLHTGLKHAAKAAGAQIHRNSGILSVDPETATVTLEDGRMFSGDVVVGADGNHSVTRKFVTGSDESPKPFGMSTFRFTVPTTEAMKTQHSGKFLEPSKLFGILDGKGRQIVSYPCRNNTLWNFVLLYPTNLLQENGNDLKSQAMRVFTGFPEEMTDLIPIAEDIKGWKLYDMSALSTWVKGRAALLGDAAHPMLPYAAQGAGLAMEDAVVLMVMLPLGTAPHEVNERLYAYHELCQERAKYAQDFGREMGLHILGSGQTGILPNRVLFNKTMFCYDAHKAAKREFATRFGAVKRA